MTNCPSNINGHGYMTILNFGAPNHIFEMTEAAVVKFCTHVGHIKLVVMGWRLTTRWSNDSLFSHLT